MQIYLTNNKGELTLLSGSSHVRTIEDLQKNYNDHLIEIVEIPESELKLVLVEANYKDKIKKSFSEIRHEVANPLNLIKIMVHILEQGNADKEKEAELIGDINKNIERITDILGSLSDKYLEDFEEKNIIRVEQFTDEILDMFRYVFKDSNVVLDIRKNRDVHSCYLTSVGTTVTQAIFNLIKNAFYILKNSDQDLKIVKLSFERVNKYLQIIIEDNGPGFDERLKDSIFYKNISTNNKEEGHGVGLQLVREYIQQNGGSISLDESFKKGARFRINFPLHGIDKKSILIIDDIEDILSSIQTTLGEHYNIKACSNTQVAYQYLLSNSVDLVVCDLKMPNENGLEFYEKVVKDYPETPFILFTAYPSIETRRIDEGVENFSLIEKPNLPGLEHQVEKMLKAS